MRLSIVIPCRNEAQYIEECLDAIYSSEIDASVELSVFVVDGMSDDGTRDVIEQLKAKYNSLELVDNKMQLTPFAFNLGIYAGGKTDYVQIVGARHILSKNYLQKSLDQFKNDKATWCVGGKIINVYTNKASELISKAMSTAFGMGIGNFRTLKESGYTDTVTSPMYPYWVFEKIGFFDEELIRNQDDDFNFRVEKAGGKIFYENEISLKYYVRGNFKGLWRQFFQYGYWKVFVNKKHKAVTTIRQLVPPLFVLYLILGTVVPFFSIKLAAFYAIPFGAYLLLNAYTSVKCANSAIDFCKLFVIFIILHVSYGLGYLKGIIEFLILNRKPSNNQKRLSR